MPLDFKPPYTVKVSDEKPGETPVMRHFLFKDKLIDSLGDTERTMWALYLHGNKAGGGK